jgi:hypothetical protein
MIIYLSEFLTTMTKKEGKNGPKTPNFRERMAKVVQVFGNLNKNLFAIFAFAVKKFCGSSLALDRGVAEKTGAPVKSRGEDFGV